MENNINSKMLRVWEASALIALCLALCAATWAQGKQDSISSGLVRLHVIAVSDDTEEQEIKLRVRDAVLDYLRPALEGAENSYEAEKLIKQEIDGIEKAAASAAEGRAVTVTLSRESYPTRQYLGFTLPAGRYESLRIILGEGAGHNWWCVVFPPLCLDASGAEEIKDVMSPEDYAIITEDEEYQLRFKAVELWGELVERFSTK